MSIIAGGGTSGETTWKQGDETTFSPETSVFYVEDGDLILQARGHLFPKQGGIQCGHTFSTFNVSQHLRELIGDALRANGQSAPDVKD